MFEPIELDDKDEKVTFKDIKIHLDFQQIVEAADFD